MSQTNDKVNPINVIESLFIVKGQQEPSVQSENRRIDVVQNLKQALDKTSISLSFIGKSQMIALGVHGMPDTFIILTMRKEGLSAHIAYKGHDFSPVSIGASDINPMAIKKKVYDAAIGDFNRLERQSLLVDVYNKETIVVSEPVLASYNKNQTSKLLTIDTKLTVNKVLFDIRATRLAFNSMRGTPGTYVIDKLTMTCQFGRFIVQNKFSVNPKGKEPTKHLEHSSFIADVYKLLNEITFEHYELLQKEYAKFEEDAYLKDMAVVQDNGLITFVTGKSPGVERISQVHWLPVINITPGIVSDDSSVGLTNPTCNLGMLSFGSHTISNVLRFMKLLNCLGSKIREDKKIKISNAGFGVVVQSQHKKVRNSGISGEFASKHTPLHPKGKQIKRDLKYIKPGAEYKKHTVKDGVDTLTSLNTTLPALDVTDEHLHVPVQETCIESEPVDRDHVNNWIAGEDCTAETKQPEQDTDSSISVLVVKNPVPDVVISNESATEIQESIKLK